MLGGTVDQPTLCDAPRTELRAAREQADDRGGRRDCGTIEEPAATAWARQAIRRPERGDRAPAGPEGGARRSSPCRVWHCMPCKDRRGDGLVVKKRLRAPCRGSDVSP
ncbi:hypothetical protein CCE02nite_31510 [Cellulosimicrobium cellulans]|uniref:Uncharacterized protein n=1 Tax=Cellulosimicrobium cellulans TaxID=1710 RepID=A0A4Y4E0K6_CELCE|nr:hypothetical protein CCE02nite_31510 [Cellulosimicrobium cellulans]